MASAAAGASRTEVLGGNLRVGAWVASVPRSLAKPVIRGDGFETGVMGWMVGWLGLRRKAGRGANLSMFE